MYLCCHIHKIHYHSNKSDIKYFDYLAPAYSSRVKSTVCVLIVSTVCVLIVSTVCVLIVSTVGLSLELTKHDFLCIHTYNKYIIPL